MKKHLRLNTKKQSDATIPMEFNYGGGEDPKDTANKNYRPMARSFRAALTRFRLSRRARHQRRNKDLGINQHFDYIRVIFHNAFNYSKYNQYWYEKFGLMIVDLSDFNREVLFATIDNDKFKRFINELTQFIKNELGSGVKYEYDPKVRFIKDFELLTTQDIIKYEEHREIMWFQLTKFPLEQAKWDELSALLENYLDDRSISYSLNVESGLLEIYDCPEDFTREIIENFDIVQNVTSSLATIISPSDLNLPERGYGFSIANTDAEDLPLIGILDTGISSNSPLSEILHGDDSFNLTETSPFVDRCDHGTAVAALAAFGRKPYAVNYSGDLNADARLLSIKIIDDGAALLSQHRVLATLREAKERYPEIKIFVLTTCLEQPKRDNQNYSLYATSIDKFLFEKDCLLFISTGNNQKGGVENFDYDMNYFNSEHTNLCPPADSMNAMVVGAAADNCNSDPFVGASNGKEFPTLYSRTGHIDLKVYAVPGKRFTKNNKNLFRPDVIESGGDYENRDNFIGTRNDALLEVLSANSAFGFIKNVGTSYATPLVANIAAQIQQEYPNLMAQTIKALIINGASLSLIRVDEQHKDILRRTAGHGLVDVEKSVSSSENRITFIIEETIVPGTMKVIPVKFPEFYSKDDMGKVRGLLKVTATLCFFFNPVPNNQLAYCPIHMAFSFFRNHKGTDILLKENEKEGGIRSRLKTPWSQNNRYKASPIPASNTQKISFLIDKKNLIEENSTLKLAIHSVINAQVIDPSPYQKEQKFSMAITVEENLQNTTGKLYDEMMAINELEAIATADLETELDLEA